MPLLTKRTTIRPHAKFHPTLEISSTIRRGQRGEAVRFVQEWLVLHRCGHAGAAGLRAAGRGEFGEPDQREPVRRGLPPPAPVQQAGFRDHSVVLADTTDVFLLRRARAATEA